MSCLGPKTSWPELVGISGEAATKIIETQNKDVNAIIVAEGSFISTDLRCDRVRVFVDQDKQLVTREPRVG